MLMCGCKTCTEMDGLHQAMQLKRRRLLTDTDKKLIGMVEGPEKKKLQDDLDQYKK